MRTQYCISGIFYVIEYSCDNFSLGKIMHLIIYFTCIEVPINIGKMQCKTHYAFIILSTVYTISCTINLSLIREINKGIQWTQHQHCTATHSDATMIYNHSWPAAIINKKWRFVNMWTEDNNEGKVVTMLGKDREGLGWACVHTWKYWWTRLWGNFWVRYGTLILPGKMGQLLALCSIIIMFDYVCIYMWWPEG